jgi:hypothetical protein
MVLGEHAPVEAGLFGQAGLMRYVRDDLTGREVERIDP